MLDLDDFEDVMATIDQLIVLVLLVVLVAVGFLAGVFSAIW
jgi:hypothetical protein